MKRTQPFGALWRTGILMTGCLVAFQGNALAKELGMERYQNSPETSIEVNLQNKNVKGTVVDQEGAPIPGATVVVKGSTQGTITDFEGSFSIEIPEGATLMVSFVGMKTQEVVVGNQMTLSVILSSDNIGLEEVVAVGYGTMRKSDLTGATSRMNAESLSKIQTSTVNEALQGKMAGVTISSNSGAPGGDMKIRIRGNNSISGNNDPLVIVDGFAGQSLSDLNPNDIESVEVLKDASATAIYGSRGANGVILVTTKGGREGKPQVTYNAHFGVQKLAKKMDLMDAASFARVVNEKRLATGGKAEYSDDEITAFESNGGVDWQDEVYQAAGVMSHDLAIAGQNKGISYLFSGQYFTQDGILKNSSFDKFNYRGNVDVELDEKIKVGVRINGVMTKDRPHYLAYANGSISNDALCMEPTLPIYDEQGGYTTSSYATVSNPVADYMEQNNYKENAKQNVNAFLDYKFAPKWNLRVSGGFSTVDYVNNRYSSRYLYTGSGSNGKASISNKKSLVWQNTNILNFKEQIDKHRIDLTFVNEQTVSTQQKSGLGSKNFDIQNGYYNVELGKEPTIPSSSFQEQKLMSFLGRANYNYDNKYLVTVSLRADGSSKFAPGHKWDYFPSASLAWRVSEEPFIKDLNIFNNLKLRTSYGVTGSQAIGPYQSQANLRTGINYPIDGTSVAVGVAPGRFNNPLLGWEKTSQYDVGFDMSVFDGALSLTADYYYKRTFDLLLNVAVPYYAGGSGSELRNVGEVENKGFEVDLGTNLSFGKLHWSSNLMATVNRNKVLDLGDQKQILMDKVGGSQNASLIRVGESMGLIYGYVYEGVWQENQAEDAAKLGNKPGDARFKDINGDNKITADDRDIIGRGYPKLTMGWSNNVSYKGFDLDFLFTGFFGNEVKNDVYARTMGWYNIDATHVDIQNRWTPENSISNIPAFSKSYKISHLAASSAVVEEGSFIRLKNISLGYTFNKEVTRKFHLEKVRVYVSGQNLWTLTNYKGYDPEVNNPGGSGSDITVGYDMAPYPMSKVFNFGVNVTF